VSEPVENIYWETPPEGVYSLSVKLYKRRGSVADGIPFKVMLTIAGQDPITVTSVVSLRKCSVDCFKFAVASDGSCKVLTSLEDDQSPCASQSALVKSPAKPKAKAKVKAKAKAKVTAAQKPATIKKKHLKKATTKCKSKVATIGASGKKAKPGPPLKKKSSKFDVFHGRKEATKRGLKKSDFVLSKKKKIVTRKKSEAGRKSGLFAQATVRAYAKLGITRFTAMRKGTPLHAAALEELALINGGA